MNPRHRRLLIPGLLVALVVVVVIGALVRSARADTPIAPTPVSAITDSRVPEASGMVVSTRDPALAYVVNDSGNAPVVFTIDIATGDVVGVTRLKATTVDVEALAVDRSGTLWVADIGDNDGVRASVALYALPEPMLGRKQVKPQRYEVTYADGSTDAETLIADPVTGALSIVSKGVLGGQLYRLPARLTTDRVNVARPDAEVDVPPLVTDGASLPDGSRIVLRSYTGLYALDAETGKITWSAAVAMAGQSESLAVEPAGASVLLGSEGLPSPIVRVELPEDQRAAMLAPASGVIDLD